MAFLLRKDAAHIFTEETEDYAAAIMLFQLFVPKNQLHQRRLD